MADTSNVLSDLFKFVYRGTVNEQLNNQHILFGMLTKRSDQFVGKKVVIDLHTGRNGGFGNRAEMAALPDGNNDGFTQAVTDVGYLYGNIIVSGQTLDRSKTQEGAFAKAMTELMKNAVNSFKKEASWQMYGDGNGVRGYIQTAGAIGAGTSINVNTLPGGAGGGLKGVQVHVNMKVDIFDNTLTTPRVTGATVTAVTRNNFGRITAIKLDTLTGAGMVAGDVLVRNGNAKAELQGFGAAINPTGVYMGIDPAVTDIWFAPTDSAGGVPRPVDDTAILNLRNYCGELTGDMPDTGLMTPQLEVQWYKLASSQRRNMNSKLVLGYKAIEFGPDLSMLVDWDCPDGTSYLISKDVWTVHQVDAPDWLNRDGNGPVYAYQYGGHKDAVYADLMWAAQLGCLRRGANGKYADLIQ